MAGPLPTGEPDSPEKDLQQKSARTNDSDSGKDMNRAGLGLQLVGAVVIFVALGWWLDSKTGSKLVVEAAVVIASGKIVVRTLTERSRRGVV